MGFFDAPPERTEPEWPEVPDEVPVIGGAVPLELVLARSDEAAVVLRSVTAYADGMELTIVAARRHQPPPTDSMHHLPFDSQIQIGLQYADGRQLRSIGWSSAASEAGGIMPDGGGGGGQHYEQQLWVWPLPPPGRLAVVIQWSDFGIDETWTWIDAGPILDAASRAAAVWPDDLPAGELPRGNKHRGWHQSATTLGCTDEPDEDT